MGSLLDWKTDPLLLNSDKSGKIFETLIFNELSAITDLHPGYQPYHDREKREIDLLLGNEKGHLIGLKVKAGSLIPRQDFRSLKWVKENIAKDKNFKGMVLYTGEDTVGFGNDFLAVPMGVLWKSS
jgi:predicted AAA+ superfamily ATPase